MKTFLLSLFFTDAYCKAACWTLIHSLWIGLIVAILAGAVLVFGQKFSSQLRYRLLCVCLILFGLITALVFYQQAGLSHTNTTLNDQLHTTAITALPADENSFVPARTGMLLGLSVFINQHSVWIFTVWLLCFTVRSLGLAGGLFYVHKIRTRKIHPLESVWNERIKQYSQKIGINQSVRLLQSELVKIPLTIGHFKPVILIPIGMIFQLPAQQIETILIHELAHIKRRDYLVNLMQSLAECIFFFNPGLLWLSWLIKQERETCCDDIVLAHTALKSNYLEALLAFHSKQPLQPTVAMSLGSNQLSFRLRRMINHENKRLNKMEKIVLLAGLLIVSAYSYMPDPETGLELCLQPTHYERIATPYLYLLHE